MSEIIDVPEEEKQPEAAASLPAVQHNQRPDFFSIIHKIASDPNFDSNKLTAVIDANERIVRFNAESAFNTAMNACQAEMPRVKRNGKIEFVDKNGAKRETPFAKLEDIDEVVRPIYQKHGFSVRYKTGTATLTNGDIKPIIYCIISHIGGHTEKDELTLPLDTSGSKNNLQAMGSTISYAKRYMIENAFNIVREGADDDGNKSFPITEAQAKEIEDLVKETKSDLKNFLLFAKADAIKNIQGKEYDRIITVLKEKKRAPAPTTVSNVNQTTQKDKK